ncbi:MAG: hypothetical protein MN733_27730 [Nitrososphaera sp.]|nr:hypothetical protein [Nitrososphaera sp.]
MAQTSTKINHWVDLPLVVDFEVVNRYPGGIDFTYDSNFSGTMIPQLPESVTGLAVRSGLRNWLPIKSGDSVYLKSRDGLVIVSTVFGKSASVSNPRGIFWLNSLKMLAEFWNDTLYVFTASDTLQSQTGFGSAVNGPGSICEGIDSTGAKYGFAATSSQAAIIDAAGLLTVVSDPDYPATTMATPVFLDGYVFISGIGANGRRIYNSVVGDATSWTASGFTQTEETGGNIAALGRHHAYIVAFCEDHIEFFKNGAVPAPNSPLIRDQEKTLRVGLINRATVAHDGDRIYFTGRDASGQSGAYVLENFKLTKVSSLSVDYFIHHWGGSLNIKGALTSFTGATQGGSINDTPYNRFATAYMITMQGKTYYLWNPGVGAAAEDVGNNVLTASPALMYDPEFKIWIMLDAGYSDTAINALGDVGHGGWPFPYGCATNETFSGTGLYGYLLQNTYGGSDDNHLAALTSTYSTGEMVDVAANGFKTGVNLEHCLAVYWPETDLGFPHHKLISGFTVEHTNSLTATTTLWGNSGTVSAVLALAPFPASLSYSTGIQSHNLVLRTSSSVNGAGSRQFLAPLFRGILVWPYYQIPVAMSTLNRAALRVSITEEL